VYPHRQIRAAVKPDISLVCDAGRMGQMLSNLLKNALHHGTPGQPVDVAAGVDDESFELVVSNFGADIAPDVMRQLFKPFWRAERRDGGGLGLGLFIVAEIAKSHGADVSVVSAEGRTSFKFKMMLERQP
jgi:signal transduction histidine kinase